MIRKAELRDTLRLAELGIEFAHKSTQVHRISVDEKKIYELTRFAITDPDTLFFVYEENGRVEGLIYGVLARPYFSSDLMLQELAFYAVKPGCGIRLLTAFEREAVIRGVRIIAVGSKPDFCDLRKLYEHHGYKQFEDQYLKIRSI